MTEVNQNNEPIQETVLRWSDQLDEMIVRELILLTIAHLKMEAVMTNATKHGNTEISLRPEQ